MPRKPGKPSIHCGKAQVFTYIEMDLYEKLATKAENTKCSMSVLINDAIKAIV